MSSSTGKAGVIVAPDESTNMDKLVSHAITTFLTALVSCFSIPTIAMLPWFSLPNTQSKQTLHCNYH
jgi:hypothetical protein